MSTSIVQLVQQQKPFFVDAVCDNAVLWEKESQFAIQLFQKNNTLAETALRNQASAQNAIINVAAVGITLNPVSKLAYLVPRDGAVHLDISYQGLIYIAQQAGVIRWCQAMLVHENDTYERHGIDKPPTHDYKPFGDRGAVVGGYCTVKTPEGDYLTEEMSLLEIEEVRAVSKAGQSAKGPWVNFWSEMARKTIVKRASKYWPKAERVDKAIDVLNQHEGLYQEPVMQHVTEDELIINESVRRDELQDRVKQLCEQMDRAEGMNELKVYFQEAYRLTRGMKILNQTVQAAYADNKVKFEKVAA